MKKRDRSDPGEPQPDIPDTLSPLDELPPAPPPLPEILPQEEVANLVQKDRLTRENAFIQTVQEAARKYRCDLVAQTVIEGDKVQSRVQVRVNA
jgi:hypothetical protein